MAHQQDKPAFGNGPFVLGSARHAHLELCGYKSLPTAGRGLLLEAGAETGQGARGCHQSFLPARISRKNRCERPERAGNAG